MNVSYIETVFAHTASQLFACPAFLFEVLTDAFCRFFPFIEHAPKEEIIVVFANRCGIEGNQTGVTHVENGGPVEEGDRVCYAGSSCAMRFKAGGVSIFDMLGMNEESLLVVDTTSVSRAKSCVRFVLMSDSMRNGS